MISKLKKNPFYAFSLSSFGNHYRTTKKPNLNHLLTAKNFHHIYHQYNQYSQYKDALIYWYLHIIVLLTVIGLLNNTRWTDVSSYSFSIE